MVIKSYAGPNCCLAIGVFRYMKLFNKILVQYMKFINKILKTNMNLLINIILNITSKYTFTSDPDLKNIMVVFK